MNRNTYDVTTGLIYLVDRNDDPNVTGVLLDQIDNLPSLWHYSVIRRNDKDYDICHSGTASTHSRESSVSWCIKECNGSWGVVVAPILNRDRHRKGTDVLGDTTSFTFSYRSGAKGVKQSGFAMIDVSHNSNYRWAREKLGRIGMWRSVEASDEVNVHVARKGTQTKHRGQKPIHR